MRRRIDMAGGRRVGAAVSNLILVVLCFCFCTVLTKGDIHQVNYAQVILCESDGPGLFQCSCITGHCGYKCLRQGVFPLWLFLGIAGVATTIISALLWVTQRRKAKTLE